MPVVTARTGSRFPRLIVISCDDRKCRLVTAQTLACIMDNLTAEEQKKVEELRAAVASRAAVGPVNRPVRLVTAARANLISWTTCHCSAN